MNLRAHLTDPLIRNNPVTLQILGICSALAVTTSLSTALTMSVALTVVLALASGLISLIRAHIPASIRLILQITIIASLVIVIDEVLQAYAFRISKELSIFVGLIVTNCLGARSRRGLRDAQPAAGSRADGIGNGLGYSLILILVGTLRELLGTGTLAWICRSCRWPRTADGSFRLASCRWHQVRFLSSDYSSGRSAAGRIARSRKPSSGWRRKAEVTADDGSVPHRDFRG